jgi:lactate permease
MSHTGMIYILAKGLSDLVSSTLYPAITPFIGALGAFISGSNNNSNILFTKLHMQTAQLMGLNVNLILAAQSAGGALGSIFAPAKVIVGCSTVGLAGKEGQVLRKLIEYGLLLVACVSIITLLMG